MSKVSDVKSLSCVQLFATPWTVACQAPPPMGFSRQEDWWGAISFSSVSHKVTSLLIYGEKYMYSFIPFFSLLFTFFKMHCLWWEVTCCIKKIKIKTSVLSVWRVLSLILTFYSWNNIQEILIGFFYTTLILVFYLQKRM